MPERGAYRRTKAEPPQPRPDLGQLLSNTAHTIQVTGPRYFCSVCLSNFHIGDPSCKAWLQSVCIPPFSVQPASIHNPTPLTDVCHIGNSVSHISHQLYSYRGLIYCNKCGSFAGSSRLVNLARACEPPTDTGLRVLTSIAEGNMPHGVTMWPHDA